MDSCRGKVIWIIGASSGIGAALAKELAARGAVLALSARRVDRLEALKGELTGSGHVITPVDAGDPVSVASAFKTVREAFGRIDSVVFMAAIYGPHDGKPKALSFIHDMLRVNIGGAFNMLDVITPFYQKQGHGQIAICASVAGYRGLPTGQPYCASKAALISLAESLRLDLAPDNIDVKVINPGFVKSPLTDKNDFPMPMIMETDKAAKALVKGLQSRAFEIHFPKRFTFIMKVLRIIPMSLYFWLMKRVR